LGEWNDAYSVDGAVVFDGGLEEQMHVAAGRRCAELPQHVLAAEAAITETEGLGCSGDVVEVAPPNHNIDVFRETSGIGLDIFDIEIDRESTSNTIVESSPADANSFSTR
jgi:hypothetical protein